MKWTGETEDQVKNRLASWHKNYAIWPVTCQNGTRVWLEIVWRKATKDGWIYAEYEVGQDAPDGMPQWPMTPPPKPK